MFVVAANTACAAGDTVIVLDAVDVLPQLSVNVHDSVYDPPHPVCVPLMFPVVVPLMLQSPLAPLE
jgi:hypothetical protein